MLARAASGRERKEGEWTGGLQKGVGLQLTHEDRRVPATLVVMAATAGTKRVGWLIPGAMLLPSPSSLVSVPLRPHGLRHKREPYQIFSLVTPEQAISRKCHLELSAQIYLKEERNAN